MLDENLPTFFLRPSPDNVKHHKTIYLSQHGSKAEPSYSLHYLDPSSPSSLSVYAVALFDSYNPDILYAEVLLHPDWTHPTLSQEEIRKNGGLAPPSEPLLPSSFTIQLYNPDQQVTITQRPGSWGGTPYWEFSMPQHTFRTPSASALDKTQSDPAHDVTTPMINFVWKREGVLHKDLTCLCTGKSTDLKGKKGKKNRDPDIAVALFHSLKEVTIHEPNLSRLDMEDYKGLEVVLLLGAAVVKDIYFGDAKEAFNIADPLPRNSSGIGAVSGRKSSENVTPAASAPSSVPLTKLQKQPNSFQPRSSAVATYRQDSSDPQLPPRPRQAFHNIHSPLRPTQHSQPLSGSVLRPQHQPQQQHPRGRQLVPPHAPPFPPRVTQALQPEYRPSPSHPPQPRTMQVQQYPRPRLPAHPGPVNFSAPSQQVPGPLHTQHQVGASTKPQTQLRSNGLSASTGAPATRKSFWNLRAGSETGEGSGKGSRLLKKASSVW